MLKWIGHESPLRTSFTATVSTQRYGEMPLPFYIECATQKVVIILNHVSCFANKAGEKVRMHQVERNKSTIHAVRPPP